jgi:hypothetical protein
MESYIWNTTLVDASIIQLTDESFGSVLVGKLQSIRLGL